MHILTQAMTEAYAANNATYRIYETVEIDHSTFDQPIRVVTGAEEDMMFPITAGGTPVLFQAVAISVTLPGSTEDGPTTAKLTISNVSSMLNDPLNAAVMSDEPIIAVYRAYTTQDLTQPGDIVGGLELWEVDLAAGSATGTLRFKELELQAFPLPTYDEQYYPAVQDA